MVGVKGAPVLMVGVLLAAGFAGCLGPEAQGGTSGETTTFFESKRFELGASGWATQAFELSATHRVDYETESRNGDDSYDVCIITPNEEEYWKKGEATRGYACNGEVTSASDSATLNEGEYVFALRCRNYFQSCVIAATLRATG